MRVLRVPAVLIVVAALMSGCGGGTQQAQTVPTAAPDAPPTATPVAEESPTPTPSITTTPEPWADPAQTITVSIERLEGYAGFVVSSFVTEADPQQRETRLAVSEGALYLASALGVRIDDDPFSATDVMGPAGEVDPDFGMFVFNGDGVVAFEAGSYAGSVEVFTPSGPMKAACSFEVEVVEGEPAVVTVGSVHPYIGNGMFWGEDPESIPECSN